MNDAVQRAIQYRINYLRRDLEIAEREAAREPVNANTLPPDQRIPFDVLNAHIEAARAAIPEIRAEIAELEAAL